MAAKNIGNVIKKINLNKKNVTIFINDEKIVLSHDAYANEYLYAGKKLEETDVARLKEFSNLDAQYKYSLKLASKYRYTEKTLFEKLLSKGYRSGDIENIIKRLKQINLINDEIYAKDYLLSANTRGLGKQRIIDHLKSKGIDNDIINELTFSSSLEKSKAQKIMKALEKKYQNRPYQKKKSLIYASLLEKGFDRDICASLINYVTSDDKIEKEQIKKDYEIVLRKYEYKYEGRELSTKIVSALKNKGYKYNDIKKVMEGDNENDY